MPSSRSQAKVAGRNFVFDLHFGIMEEAAQVMVRKGLLWLCPPSLGLLGIVSSPPLPSPPLGHLGLYLLPSPPFGLLGLYALPSPPLELLGLVELSRVCMAACWQSPLPLNHPRRPGCSSEKKKSQLGKVAEISAGRI